MNKKVIIIGAGGHAKSVADIILKNEDIIVGFLDDNIKKDTIVMIDNNLKVIGKIKDIEEFSKKEDIYFVIGIGNNAVREKISIENNNLKYHTAIHPTSNIASDVKIEEGTVIMANACINVGAKIGKHCIINTGAIVEHDDIIKDYVHLSPGAVLSGTVVVGNRTHLGTGVKVKNNISITSDVVVGVGGVVVKDINEQGTYIGVPVKKI